MQRAAAIPYYTSGAATGLALGYLYAWLQVLQLIPGLGWAANIIRSILPEDHAAQQYSSTAGSSSSSPASAAVASAQPVGAAHAAAVLQPQQQQLPLEGETLAGVELSSGSFAVMDAGALGSALYEMERPTNTANSSSSSNLLPPTPHPSFQTASNPAAGAAADTSRGISAFDNATAVAAETADTATSPAAAAAGGDGARVDQMQLMLSSLRDRLASFPLDNMSPTTTATALSLYSNLPPASSSEYGGDEPPPDIDLAVGPAEPVEGDLDFTVTNSTGSNLLPPETPTAAAAAAADVPGGSSSTTVLPKPGDTVVPLLAVPGVKRAAAGAAVKFAPGVTGSPIPSAVTSGVTTYPTAQQQQRGVLSGTSGSSSTVPLSASAIQERERRVSTSSAAPAADAANDNSYNTYNTLGIPRAAYAVGLPAQRVVATKLGRTGSTSSSTTSSPRRYHEQQQQYQRPPAAAAAALNASIAAAAAGSASPGALQPPRLPSAHAAVAIPAAAYSAAAAGSGESARITAAASEGSKLLASSSSSDGGRGDDRRPVTDTPPSASMPIKPTPGVQGGVRTLNLQPPTPASTSAPVAGVGVNGSPRSMHSVSSIRTTDSTGTVERKKQKGLLSMLKSKAMKGRQQVR